jgi:hypothetical protein
MGMIGMTKRLLMIAFHYPPCLGSSGLQRTLSFSKHLSSFGWNPVVLTPHPRVYEQVGNDQLADIPSDLPVKRTFALDTSRHLQIKGRYPLWLALPDKWISWLMGAIPAGLALVRKYRPNVLWSTYPIGTAHLIGLVLHRLTGIPWIADFRDPMVEFDDVTQKAFPRNPAIRRARLWVERLTMRHCVRSIFVAPGALRIYAERYPEFPRDNFQLVSNGYEEESFKAVENQPIPRPRGDNRLVLLHSGVLYPTPDRHPGHFFTALAELSRSGKISSGNLKVVLRASSSEDVYQKQILDLGLEDIVGLEPHLGYKQALAEMLSVDGLLVFQGHDSNPAIPAKLYEYIRSRRPIFALVDGGGDTAALLREANVGTLVPLDSSEQIASGLLEFLGQVRSGTAPIASEAEIERHSRKNKAAELASIFDKVLQT